MRRIVVNVAGPHSYLINRMAGVEEGMKIKTRALRQEVCHVPAPERHRLSESRERSSPTAISAAIRDRRRAITSWWASEDPECDEREYVDPDNYDTSFTKQWTAQAMREAQRIEGSAGAESEAGRRRPLRCLR